MFTKIDTTLIAGYLFIWIITNMVVHLDGERIHQRSFLKGPSEGKLRHVTNLRVTTVLIEPYVMLDNDNHSDHDSGNHAIRYYGYLVDLLDHISEMLGFVYVLEPVADGEFGYRLADGSGRWTGMIGQIIDKNADLIAAPMYITPRREEVVDFTRPFMDIYASIILRKRADGSHKHISTLIDIINRDFITVGTLKRGLIHHTLKSSNDTLVQRLNAMMLNKEYSSFTKSNDIGLSKVRQSDYYAYILPSNIAEYVTQRKPCDLYLVNTTLCKQQFAFAGHKNSALLSFINDALDILFAQGYMECLYQKWWINRGDCFLENKRDAPGMDIKFEHMTNIDSKSCGIYLHGNIVVVLLSMFYMYYLSYAH